MKKKGLLPEIPGICVPGAVVGKVISYGAENYVVTADGVDKKGYLSYLSDLGASGFTKYAENEEGLGNVVFCATYTREEIVVTVTFSARQRKMFVSVCPNLPLSEHLNYKADYLAGCKKNVNTKLYMMELWWFGNSFVFQLKNGHFIISDGGTQSDCRYLLDHLEQLVPNGEKPVIEAWIISHAHGDHCGIMGTFIDNPALAERIFVEGVYYNEPGEAAQELDVNSCVLISWIRAAARHFKTLSGKRPEIYRPQTGQRYYFCDITMDIVHCQEQLPREDYSGDFNDSSTWCMYTVEGQKLLFCGDGEKGSMGKMMETYDREYLTVDVMTLMHHGFNTRDNFTDYCSVKTVLLTVKEDLPVRRTKQNAHLKENIQECFAWGDGTKVLTFPYKVGSYECLAKTEWKYNLGEKRPEQPNIYTY